ncbi:Hypp9111 [Branchiostoma lanceolatum]|uniref:Hypp9111 protein n=1 Tax=Branchiostoma lanceolatum TaxID=7740 RepID=A0A8K0EHH0_BRALA|nr:Hypp9111 [Branchiostoma lanceolatum]
MFHSKSGLPGALRNVYLAPTWADTLTCLLPPAPATNMSPRPASVLCLLAVLLCCCINSSVGVKKTKEQLLAQVDDVVKNLKTMNSKRGLGSEGVSRSSLGQLYMTEMELKRALHSYWSPSSINHHQHGDSYSYFISILPKVVPPLDSCI